MSARDERDELAAAVALMGALPMPVGPEPQDVIRRERYLAALRDADPYALVERRDDRDRLADAVIAVADAELAELRARVAELEAAPATVFRASHDSIVMGLYTTAAAAREHCEAEERRSWPTGTNLSFDWIEDEEDGVAELVVVAGQNEASTTGYVVDALEVASKPDPEADE